MISPFCIYSDVALKLAIKVIILSKLVAIGAIWIGIPAKKDFSMLRWILVSTGDCLIMIFETFDHCIKSIAISNCPVGFGKMCIDLCSISGDSNCFGSGSAVTNFTG